MIKVYEERLQRFREDQVREEAQGLRLGWVRAGVFVVGSLFYLGLDVWSGPLAQACGVGMGLALVLFIALVIWHRRVRRRRDWAATMVRINQVALARVARDWEALPPVAFEDPGTHHPYAYDLDVCGETSLFRLLTTVTLPPGLETLRRWLLDPAPPDEVRKRQEAVAELAPQVEFRQALEAQGCLLDCPPSEPIRRFLAWAESDSWLSGHGWVLRGARALPLLTAVLVALFWLGWTDGPWWLVSMGAAFALGNYFRTKIHPLMELASAGQERFGRYAAILGLLLEAEMEAPALQELQRSVRSTPVGAGQELRRLGRRVAWADIRYSSMAHAPLQALFVWDVHMLAGLENWKARSGLHVRKWLEALGELEALSAMAALLADNPDWCFPKFSEDRSGNIIARGLSHPLLPQDRCVRNALEIGPPGTFLFVTGSNMSGKSTLLRAVGINAVLAQAGGPVCAEAMELPPVQVHTSMRTADSLAEGVSQYMAELNRIRQVVDAAWANQAGTVLFLLDEPLQGTNEAERRVAVQTILGHLVGSGAIGAVATHDLHLDETERLKAAAKAVHLEGTVGEGEDGPLLSFDYLLKPGRATSTNALALLRAVGLGGEAERRQPSRPTEP
ncbi:MAG: hypothetical protein MUO50_10165 [Longimicrobiales bacterium]|nr:hypothetical protein [Longimicrobiales bacterium]